MKYFRSIGEVKRLIKQGAVTINGKVTKKYRADLKDGDIIRAGKQFVAKVKIINE